MSKLLRLATYGMKNIENEIVLEFANSTIEKGIKKINSLKGIFGYNGAGKSAIISSVYFYKNIICNQNFLLQNSIKSQLDKLINYKRNEFFISMIFDYKDGVVIKHSLKLSKDNLTSNYIISEEDVSLSIGRTLNDKYVSLVSKIDKIVTINTNKSSKALDYLVNVDLDNLSIVQVVFRKILESEDNNSLSDIEKVILSLFADVNNIDVYLSDSDYHRNYKVDKDMIKKLIECGEKSKNISEDYFQDFNVFDDIVSLNDYELYKKENKKLEKFIKLFKPELKEIQLMPIEDRKVFHVKKNFVYEDYIIEAEFESSGIKQLIKLFTYLMRCAKGNITFIDEIDTNLNTVYFEKLLSFYKNYGEGQLIFTTHNIESMNALKGQGKSIVVLGIENRIDTWVGKGNRSPISDYLSGAFPNSPMTIEDFDFINIFYGEEE